MRMSQGRKRSTPIMLLSPVVAVSPKAFIVCASALLTAARTVGGKLSGLTR
jgi:hypothetical protein